MLITTLIPKILEILVLISDIILILFAFTYLFCIFTKKRKNLMKLINKYFTKHSLKFAFLVALTSTLGSLFYSEILNYTPCELCWYQRILMYPLVIILGIALFKKDKKVTQYVLPMSIIGLFISFWHYLSQRYSVATTCSIDSVVPCTVKYTFAYGYITIPLMALTGFLLIIILTLIWNYSNKK